MLHESKDDVSSSAELLYRCPKMASGGAYSSVCSNRDGLRLYKLRLVKRLYALEKSPSTQCRCGETPSSDFRFFTSMLLLHMTLDGLISRCVTPFSCRDAADSRIFSKGFQRRAAGVSPSPKQHQACTSPEQHQACALLNNLTCRKNERMSSLPTAKLELVLFMVSEAGSQPPI